MVSRIILALVQLVVGWFGAPHIVRYVPNLGVLQLFVYAVAFAVLVWIVGLVLSQGLKDIWMPSISTLAATLVGALIGAALIMLLPEVAPGLLRLLPSIPPLAFPLVGAILGYQSR
jgi:hypothetical protein